MTWQRKTDPIPPSEPRDDGWNPQPNIYAEPEGYDEKPAPVIYRIREVHFPDGYPANRYMLMTNPIIPEYWLGEMVERQTEPKRDPWNGQWYHGMDERDQLYGDLISGLIQQACAYFYEPDDSYKPMVGVPGSQLTDEEVEARIHRIDAGENTREAERTSDSGAHQGHYPLVDLPLDQKRALIEQIDELRRKFRIEIIGPVPEFMQPEETK